jgi:acyl-coenzyme A thioesterase PaaI-like protein
MHQFTSLWALHGGASVALADGKCGFSVLLIQKNKVRGIEISANHLKVFTKESLRDCNYSQRKNASSVGNKITDEEGI